MKLTKSTLKQLIKEEMDKATHDELSEKERVAGQKIMDIIEIYNKAMHDIHTKMVGDASKGPAARIPSRWAEGSHGAQKIKDILEIFEEARQSKSFGFQVGTSGKGAAMIAIRKALRLLM